MKPITDLFEQIIAFDNLYFAAREALLCKRRKTAPAKFYLNLGKKLIELQEALISGTYKTGAYKTFYIYEPKKRLISAAPFVDRVVHHAICRVIEPLFDKSFIYDTYACRKGKGTHAAINRFTQFARRYRYALKCDIKKFFPSIDHEILKAQIRKRIGDEKLLQLIDMIIDHSNPQEAVHDYFPGDDLFTPYERKKGLPIGNLTSQFFANIYLNRFDHYIKDDLGIKAYIRYVDDMVYFHDDISYLLDIHKTSQEYLNQFRMLLHPNKCHIFQTSKGIPFLGFIIFPDHRLVRRESVTRYKRRLKKMQKYYREGLIEPSSVRASVHSWIGHVKHGDSYGLRKKILGEIVFKQV